MYNSCNTYCSRERQQGKEVVLIFRRSELIYDVENYSYVEGDIMKTDDAHLKHQVIDIAQSGNIDRVTRVLNLAYAECVEMLYPYTKREVAEGELDNVLQQPEEYRISMMLPHGFSLTTVELMRNLIHEYLVCRVLADWMSITNPQSQENWERKINQSKDKIQSCLLSRRGKVKIKLNPF